MRSSILSKVSKEFHSSSQKEIYNKEEQKCNKVSKVADKTKLNNEMSMYSREVINVTERPTAVETIKTAAETQMLVESVLQDRSKSLSHCLKPKVDVQTEPLSTLTCQELQHNSIRNVPRVVTSVCVCTNTCCKSDKGELCESCPMRDVKAPKEYQKCKAESIESSVPKRYGSPVITGVSVTINNPRKIKQVTKDLSTEKSDKNIVSTSSSASATNAKEPFVPVYATHPQKAISFPEESKPYLPPEKSTVQRLKPDVRSQPKQQNDTPLTSALRIAPNQPFTPIERPASGKKKKPKEDPLLTDLPKPRQWMSMVSALTIAPDRPYSPFTTESSAIKQTFNTDISTEEIHKISETQQQIIQSSVCNETMLMKSNLQPKGCDKSKPVNADKEISRKHAPPDLKSMHDYEVDCSVKRSSISAQVVVDSHKNKELSSNTKIIDDGLKYSMIKQEETNKVNQCRGKPDDSYPKTPIEKQSEEILLKKPLELTEYLQKREYLPQYQLLLNYDETIELPHHKNIKKLLPNDKRKDLKQMKSSDLLTCNQSVGGKISTTRLQREETTSSHVLFEPVKEYKSSHSSLRPQSLTPSIINKPAPVIPYYQENLVATQKPAPETNTFDPKSPHISRSPSPCFNRVSSPAPGPPPNPLQTNESIHKFTKQNWDTKQAKESILEYIPQYREKVDRKEAYKDSENLDSEIFLTKAMQNRNTSLEFHRDIPTTGVMTQQNTSLKNDESFYSSEKLVCNSKRLTSEKSSLQLSDHTCQYVKNHDITKSGTSTINPANSECTTLSSLPTKKDNVQCKSVKQSQPSSNIKSYHKNVPAPLINSKCNVACSDSLLTTTTPVISLSVPTVTQPNIGTVGGRQSGAIGVAPKRGRGVLNVGGLIGSRTPLCGHCRTQIRYLEICLTVLL